MKRSTGWCSARAGRSRRPRRSIGPSFAWCPKNSARAFGRSRIPSFAPAWNRSPRGWIRAAARRRSTGPTTIPFQPLSGVNEPMKPNLILAAATVLLASAGCNAEKAGDSAAPAAEQVPTVKPPEGGDWSQVVTPTPAGGFMMGNANAGVKLIEYGSMTCPHCAEFDETGVQPLIDNYVKSGRVSYEYRNYVRDPYDLAASLIARCNGAQGFFP